MGVSSAATVRALAAQGDFFGNQAEWEQTYAADPRLSIRRTTTPVLSQQTYTDTEQAVASYRALAEQGGWQAVPTGATLQVGSKGPAVASLRQRLIISGDLDRSSGNSPVFDSYVKAGVQRFQARHGIGATGVVAKQTFQALNISIEDRIRQLELNLSRLRAYTGDLGRRYIAMNIPAAAVETVENGRVFSHHAAGVGKIDRQSPIMKAMVVDINFNPFWTVPASIIRKDLIPKMQADPNYLTENKIRVIDKAGNEVPPTAINWNSMDATNYRFRQDPGADFNSLGVVRVNIPNKDGVYMHDTPAKGIFGDDFRFVSSGCVRVQNIRDYVAWILKETPGWGRDQIDEAIRSGQRIDAKPTAQVPVYWVYVTAWANDGIVQFREDIYEKDKLGTGPSALDPQAANPPPRQPAGAKPKPQQAQQPQRQPAQAAAQNRPPVQPARAAQRQPAQPSQVVRQPQVFSVEDDDDN